MANAQSKSAPAASLPEKPKTEAPALLTRAREFAVKTVGDAETALKMRAEINGEIKRLNNERLEETRPLDHTKSLIMARYARPIDMLNEALKLYDGKVREFNDEQRAIARREQERVDREAAAERRRLEEQEGDTRRKAAEKAAADRKAAEEAAAAGRAAEAAKLNARADRTVAKAEEKAVELQDRAAAVVAPIVEAEAPKVKGVQQRKTWKWRIKNPAKIKPSYQIPDEVTIGKLVRSVGRAAVEIVGEGLEVWEEEGFAS